MPPWPVASGTADSSVRDALLHGPSCIARPAQLVLTSEEGKPQLTVAGQAGGSGTCRTSPATAGGMMTPTVRTREVRFSSALRGTDEFRGHATSDQN